MSPDEPAAGPDPRVEREWRAQRLARATERSYLALVPWRSFRRVLFLLIALMSVIVLKRSAGGFFHALMGAMGAGPSAPATTPTPTPTPVSSPSPAPKTTVHLQLGSPAR